MARSKSASAEMQAKTRKDRAFPEHEASLPRVNQGKSSSPWARLSLPSKLHDILSYLGPANPLPQPITANDTVWLFDNIAYRGGPGNTRWQAEFVAATFANEPSCNVAEVVSSVAAMVGLSRDAAESATIEERLKPFLVDILPGRKLDVRFAGSTNLTLGPGGRNGISSNTRALPDHASGETVSAQAQVPSGTAGILEMSTTFVEPEGWMVISDVDDTIKITQTNDPIGILRTTFIDPPTPVSGMPELYRFLAARLTPSAPFFYLSASPYNLYPFLHAFRSQHFPPGPLILRDASWLSLPGLLTNLTVGTEEYKTNRLDKLHAWLPRRRAVLVGDSTQSDPEAYGEAARKYPGWIGLILIRKVADIAALGIEDKNRTERFERAFRDLPREMWFVFEEPGECERVVEETVKRS